MRKGQSPSQPRGLSRQPSAGSRDRAHVTDVMDVERSHRVLSLYRVARAQADDQRSAFLESACSGDDALRHEVESLLAHDGGAEASLTEAMALDRLGKTDSETVQLGAQPETTLGKYRIDRLLGRGGMGTVFLAYDTVLHRQVALKVIRGALDGETSRQLLLREARNAAALNHPHICTIHEVGDADEAAFIAMEYVEGRSLRDRLDAGALSLEEAVRYGLQAADALAYAHEHSVIHRDFKAANAIVTESGWLKVVDFGLAQRGDALMADATTVVTLVPAGVAAGTPYAMAPEQIRGATTDARTDVWALGVLLFEMVTGARPFNGSTIPELFSSILRDAVAPLSNAVPSAIADVIARCLEKDPGRRYQDAGEFRRALQIIETGMATPWSGLRDPLTWRWQISVAQGLIGLTLLTLLVFVTANRAPLRRLISRPLASRSASSNVDTPLSPGAGGHRALRRSVALLGFKNVSAREEVAYISTALDQGLGSDLATGERLRIISGEEISRMKHELHLVPGETLAGDTLRRVRASLGIDVVVTGSYTALGAQGGSQVRVDIRVQDTESGQLIASASSTGTETELLNLIAENGAAVRRTLGLSGVEAQQIANAALPVSRDARRLYAEGLDALRRFDAKGARDLLERSIAQEPDFALAHVGLANAWSILGYDAQAAREAAAATGLARALRKEDQTWIEGQYREYTREWGSAIAAYRALVTNYPDQTEYALKLADAQTSAGVPKDALITLASLASTVPGSKDDPRVLLAEASAVESLGDARRQETSARAAIAAAEHQGAGLLVARGSIALGRALQVLGNTTAATEANEAARRLFEEAGDRRGVARALIQLGTLARDTGKLRDAERILRSALQISREVGNKRQTTQSLNELANVFFHLRRFELAAKMYDEAVTVSRELGDQGAEARALGNLASVHYEQGNVLQAQRFDEQALSIKRAIGDQRSIAFSLINIAETAADLGKLEEAQKMYEESRAINEKLDAKGPLSYSLSGLSTVALRRDQLPLAQEMIEKSLQLRTAINDIEGILDAEISLANVVFEREDITAASEVLRRISDRIEHGAPEQVARAAVVRATLLTRQGRAREGRSVLSPILQRSAEGYGAATGVAIELEEARLFAALGDMSAAVAKASGVAVRARTRGLLAFELEADLVLATIKPIDQTSISRLIQRARAANFALIGRKAETLLTTRKPPT
jgi:serine/threonine protein kinase/tetratricopeptide (TPR) repeat protein